MSSSNGGNPANVTNGYDRTIGDASNAWSASMGDHIELTWDTPVDIGRLRVVFDSNLCRPTHNMVSYYTFDQKPFRVPPEMVKRFRVQTRSTDGSWGERLVERNNYQRLVWLDVDATTDGIRLIIEESWGNDTVKLFAIDAYRLQNTDTKTRIPTSG